MIGGRPIRDLDLALIAVVFLIVLIGIAAIYSATYDSEAGAARNIYQKQILWVVFSTVVLIGTVRIPNRLLYTFSYGIFGISLLVLVSILTFGTEGMGVKRWLALGPLRIQPSELAKITTVLALARYLSSRNVNVEKPGHIIVTAFLVFIPAFLVAKQPDLGTALVFGAALLPMLYWAGLRLLYLFFILSPLFSGLCAALSPYSFAAFIILLAVTIYLSRLHVLATVALSATNLTVGMATPYLWENLHDYQRQRIMAFVNPDHDPLGAGYQIIQSKVAIGSGGFWGKGFLQGTQTKLAFLPEQHTDFIFSVIGEELGFIGAVIVLVLFLLLIWRAIRIASAARSEFLSLIAVGIASILTFHVFVNVGITIGVMPVTGLPLPFVSYGGSSMLANMVGVGLLLNINLRRHEY